MVARGTRLALACAVVSVVLLASTCEGLFTESSPVKVVDDKAMKKMMKKDGVYLVKFFAPWCGHCKNLAPEWEKLGKAMKGVGTVAAIDVDANKEAGQKYKIQGFPTIKAISISNGKVDFEDEYKGERTAKAIASFGMRAAKKAVESRLGSKKKKGSSGEKRKPRKQAEQPSGGAQAPPPAGGEFYANDPFVVRIDSKNFASTVKTKKAREDHWMVEFYAPWCGHCKALKPAWSAAAAKLDGKVKFGAVNCDDEKNKGVCSKFGVQGFPTLKYFGPEKEPETYSGQRDEGSLVRFAEENYQRSLAPKATELTSSAHFDELCGGEGGSDPKAHLCLLAFLPDILDTQAAGRNAYIDVLNEVSKTYAGLPYAYLWAAAGSQMDLESQFQVGGFGYPALALYSPKKRAYATLKAGFEAKEIDSLVKLLRRGKAQVTSVQGALRIGAVTPWDGKDGVVEAEEEISLEELKEL